MIAIDTSVYILTLFLVSSFRHSELTVEDPVKHSEKIPVYINITLLKMNCDCKL